MGVVTRGNVVQGNIVLTMLTTIAGQKFVLVNVM